MPDDKGILPVDPLDIHSSPLLGALRRVLQYIPHRPYCARTVLKVQACTCDVGDRLAIAYEVVVSLVHDLRKGQR